MARILVAGLINIETTLRVDGFPVAYEPVRYPFHGVRATLSGVGLNVAKALRTLGDEVRFLSLVGPDEAPRVREALAAAGVPADDVLPLLAETPRSVILHDPDGRRMIHVDLKDAQERAYPADAFAAAAEGCDLAVICNIGFARGLLGEARRRGLAVATDVHAIADLDSAYDRDWMAAADVLFMSHERLPRPPEEWARMVLDRYPARVAVVGLGVEGALLLERGGAPERIPAVRTRPVANTIGAGDALFSAFVHYRARGLAAREALRRAAAFASWKVGAVGAAEGFLSEAEVEALLGAGG